MNYYLDNEASCIVVDLREVNSCDRYRYEEVLDKFRYLLDTESYEDNLYHLYIKTEGDWESSKELSVELDEMELALDIEWVENEEIDFD